MAVSRDMVCELEVIGGNPSYSFDRIFAMQPLMCFETSQLPAAGKPPLQFIDLRPSRFICG